MYKVFLERHAERDLRKLAEGLFARAIAAIRALAQNPRPPGSRKLAGAKNYWRIRVGDYRVVYEVNDDTQSVHVRFVRHRREAYR